MRKQFADFRYRISDHRRNAHRLQDGPQGKADLFQRPVRSSIRLHRTGADRSAAQYHPASGHAAGSLCKSLGYAQGRQTVGWRRQEPAQERRVLLGSRQRHADLRRRPFSGYMSIRSRLPADQRKEAEQVYALLRAQKASAYRIDAGIIRKRSAFDLFAFLRAASNLVSQRWWAHWRLRRWSSAPPASLP